MSIITQKMKADRQSALQLWIPGKEVAGNSVFDVVNGIEWPDAASIEYTTANAPTIVTTANDTIAGLDAITLGKYGMLIAGFQVVTSYAFQNFNLGDSSSGIGILVSGTAAAIRNAATATSGATGGTPAAGVNFFTAAVWDDANLYTYYGVEGACALVDTDAIAASILTSLDSGLTLTTTSQINVTFAAPFYGAALFGWENGLPSDIATQIPWIANAWLNGDKSLPKAWES